MRPAPGVPPGVPWVLAQLPHVGGGRGFIRRVVFPEQDRGVLVEADPVGLSVTTVDTGHQALITDRRVDAAETRWTGLGNRIHDDRVHDGVWHDPDVFDCSGRTHIL